MSPAAMSGCQSAGGGGGGGGEGSGGRQPLVQLLWLLRQVGSCEYWKNQQPPLIGQPPGPAAGQKLKREQAGRPAQAASQAATSVRPSSWPSSFSQRTPGSSVQDAADGERSNSRSARARRDAILRSLGARARQIAAQPPRFS